MSLQYSRSALNVLKKFHRSDIVVYVEGEEDKIFWDHFFENLNLHVSATFKVAGGCEEIDKYVDKMINEDAKIIVVRDRDYTIFTKHVPRHAREIYTLGHSIENLVYTPENISKCIGIMSGSGKYDTNKVERWLIETEEAISELQVYEIASLLRKNSNLDGVIVLSDNPFDLIDQKTMPFKICPTRLAYKISQVSIHFSSSEIMAARKIYSRSRGERYKKIRGHFMTGLVYYYIMNAIDSANSRVAKSKFHLGATYRILVGFSDLRTIPAIEVKYYKRQLKSAIKDLGVAV